MRGLGFLWAAALASWAGLVAEVEVGLRAAAGVALLLLFFFFFFRHKNKKKTPG